MIKHRSKKEDEPEYIDSHRIIDAVKTLSVCVGEEYDGEKIQIRMWMKLALILI